MMPGSFIAAFASAPKVATVTTARLARTPFSKLNCVIAFHRLSLHSFRKLTLVMHPGERG